jgi:hypothetical protein
VLASEKKPFNKEEQKWRISLTLKYLLTFRYAKFMEMASQGAIHVLNLAQCFDKVDCTLAGVVMFSGCFSLGH